MKNKVELLNNLKKIISDIRGKLSIEKSRNVDLINKSLFEIKSLSPDNQLVYSQLKYNTENRIREIDHLYSSPFFMKCEIDIENKGDKKIYFAKHQFTDEGIYSWTSPIAQIRFENPGSVNYKLPNGSIVNASLKNKEQYMIVDGKVLFYTTEGINNPRELVHQEHFSTKKDGFILPEIVAVMEKAQDMVIRAHHIGPFIISGPAGSGKTTLALHRVAYLMQAPDTSHIYDSKSIIIFVQDNGTKEYFSHLLPELGIQNVKITTFFEWAREILDIPDAKYVERRGVDDLEKNKIEFYRLQQIKNGEIPTWANTKKFLVNNQSSGLDRIDMTIALLSFIKQNKKLQIKTKYTAVVKGKFKEKTRISDCKYSLIVVDEFQNYMSDQLKLFNTCLNKDTESVIYVGDIAQQVFSGTLKSLKETELSISDERIVRLHKVYRNTLQILNYIKGLGFDIEIPAGIKEGVEVKDNIITSEKEIVQYIKNILLKSKGLVGIISKNIDDINYLRKYFCDEKRIHFTSMASSQGVEFDIVCMVNINKDILSTKEYDNYPIDYIDEKKKILKDLLYVALTRAISELHIIGDIKLTDIKTN